MKHFMRSDLLSWWQCSEWLNKLLDQPNVIIISWQVIPMTGIGMGGQCYVVALIENKE